VSYALAPRVLRLLLTRITDFAEPVGEARRRERFSERGDRRQMFGAKACGIAARVRLLELPSLPEKGDVVDWVAAGGTAGKF